MIAFPVKVVTEASAVVLMTGADTAQTTEQVLTGDIKRAPEIVIMPVKGSAEGLVEAAGDSTETESIAA